MTDAAAEALAPESVSDAPEMTEDQAMDAVWDKMQPDDEPEPVEGPEEVEDPETAEDVEEDDPESDDDPDEEADDAAEEEGDETPAPTELPKAVREAWKDIPADAREAILSSTRDLNRKLADQGRLVQGIAPIRDSLAKAAQDLPALANMKPEQVASEVMGLARISQDFADKPVETMVSLIKQHGLEEPMRKIFAGQNPGEADMNTNAMVQHIQRLERQLQQVADPNYIRSQVEDYTSQTTAERDVTTFAAQAEHWEAVEPHLPAAIQFVQASAPDASPQDVLKRAYDLAVSQFVPEAQEAKAPAVEETAPAPDPEKLKAAQKAKSINVQSTSTGRKRTLSEDELLDQAWARAQNS